MRPIVILSLIVFAGLAIGRRALADGPLVCQDGSQSPTCTVDGSRKGCCSGHGGVKPGQSPGGCGTGQPPENMGGAT